MTKLRNNLLYTTLSLLVALFFSACSQEDLADLPNGKLQLAIGQVATDLQTRATPSELGKPVAEKFNIKVQRSGTSLVAYEGRFVESIEVKTGKYDITATYGEDVKIGRDMPFYIGTAQAIVEKDKPNSVTVPCKVGNSLISVRFGEDETERLRFERFYEDYGIIVKIDEYSTVIKKDETATSVYFSAGSAPEIIFYGTLKLEQGRAVSMTLTHEDMPTAFQAADHAKITVSLPDPESAVKVKISKLELTEARLDETIPLSWLPVPTATAEHTYSEQGLLTGTKLTFSNAYPEMTWEARISNEAGDTVRKVKGTGALVSEYTDSEEWPYLMAGKYKATYFLHTEGSVDKVSSREFFINAPQLEVTLGGYTSHSLYEEGNITAANQSDGHTIYNPQIVVKIAPELIAMKKYGYQMEYTFNEDIVNSVQNTITLNNAKLTARTQPYVMSADVVFDGVRVQKSRNFFLTGIPFHFEPPTTDTWEKTGNVENKSGYVRFGHMSDGAQNLRYKEIAVPAGTKLSLDHKFMVTGDVKNTFTIYAGEQALVSASASGWAEENREGTEPFTLSSAITVVRCTNSYGAGLSYTDLYRVGMKYRQQ